MQPNESPVQVQMEGEVLHVRFRDQDIERTILPEIEQHLRQQIDRTDKPRLVIDFENVSYLPTMGLGTLVSIHKWVREKGGQMRLANLDDKIRGTLVVSRLDRILEIHDTADAAVASFD